MRVPAPAGMPQRISLFTLTVRDYDEAIAFYTRCLGFDVLEDTDLGNGKRWVQVRPRGSTGTAILLARAASEEGSCSAWPPRTLPRRWRGRRRTALHFMW